MSLYLDPQIRDWVLFPITVVMVCTCPPLLRRSSADFRAQILVGVLRHYIVTLLQTPPKKLTRAAIREQ